MELPFLKNKNRNSGGGGPPQVNRVSGEGTDSSVLMGHIAEEIFEAFEKKNMKALMEGFHALVLMIRDEDEKQDEES